MKPHAYELWVQKTRRRLERAFRRAGSIVLRGKKSVRLEDVDDLRKAHTRIAQHAVKLGWLEPE